MRPSRDHVHRLYLAPGYLELHRLPGIDVPLLDEPMPRDDDELLPFAVVPMVALGDAGPADVDGHLPAVEGVDQFGEGAPVVAVHLKGVSELLLRGIGEIEDFIKRREAASCSWIAAIFV